MASASTLTLSPQTRLWAIKRCVILLVRARSSTHPRHQSSYAAGMLYVVALAVAKMTTLQFLETLARTNLRRMIVRSFMALDVAWALVAVIALIFQCSVPHTWAILSDKCFRQNLFWDVIGAFDIIIDLAIIGLPVYLLFDLQLPLKKRISTMAAFSFRIVFVSISPSSAGRKC
jgi:hypothetical protein